MSCTWLCVTCVSPNGEGGAGSECCAITEVLAVLPKPGVDTRAMAAAPASAAPASALAISRSCARGEYGLSGCDGTGWCDVGEGGV